MSLGSDDSSILKKLDFSTATVSLLSRAGVTQNVRLSSRALLLAVDCSINRTTHYGESFFIGDNSHMWGSLPAVEVKCLQTLLSLSFLQKPIFLILTQFTYKYGNFPGLSLTKKKMLPLVECYEPTGSIQNFTTNVECT